MPPIDMVPQFDTDALLVLGLVFFAVIIINLSPLLRHPFEYLETSIHKLGHVTATSLSGGITKGFKVFRKPVDGAKGISEREGGNSLVVLPAGYVGVPLFSAGLILLSSLPHFAPYILSGFGLLLTMLALRFGTNVFIWLVGLGFGVLLIGVAWQAHLVWSIFLLNLIAIQTGLSGLQEFGTLSQVVRHDPEGTDDASKMAKEFSWWPFRKPMFWVWTWGILSVLILVAAFSYTWIWGVLVA